MEGLSCAILIPDTHRKWHHVRAYNLMLEVASFLGEKKNGGLKGIYILGDYADFYFASGHGPKHPKLLNTTVEEVESVNEGLDELDKLFPSAKKVYIEGNHENRLTRFCQNKCPELFGYVDAKELFKINGRPGWTWIPYGPAQRVSILGSKLYARHEPLGTSAKATSTRALCSVVYGHIHRIEESHIVGLDGTNHVSFSVGWLGDKRKDEIFGYIKGHAQWQLGFGIVYVDQSTGLFYHNKIHILERGNKLTCVVNGKRFTG